MADLLLIRDARYEDMFGVPHRRAYVNVSEYGDFSISHNNFLRLCRQLSARDRRLQCLYDGQWMDLQEES